MADDQRAPSLPVAVTQALQRYLVQQEASVRDMWELFEAPIELGTGFPRGRMEQRRVVTPVLPAPQTVGRNGAAKSSVTEVLGRVVRNLDVDYCLVQENRRIFASLCAAVFQQAVAAAPDRRPTDDGPTRTDRGQQWRRQQRQLMPPPLRRPLPLHRQGRPTLQDPQSPASLQQKPQESLVPPPTSFHRSQEQPNRRSASPLQNPSECRRLQTLPSNPSFRPPNPPQWQQQLLLRPTPSPVADQRPVAGGPAGTPLPANGRQRQNRRFPWTMSLRQQRRLLQPPSQLLSGQQTGEWREQPADASGGSAATTSWFSANVTDW